jgi:predicted deacylase
MIIDKDMDKGTELALHNVFNELTRSEIDGVPGVLKIETGRPGPVLGITACTHGNEPSGLAVFEQLLQDQIQTQLRCGTVYFVVNNICATERFLHATTEEEIRASRYCDVNMNRLPKEVLLLGEDARYEGHRTRELYPIWRQFEYGLDIHSTLEPSDPMIISRGDKLYPELLRGFPIRKLISNIDVIQIGKPAFHFYGDMEDASVFAIEAGQHTDPHSFKRAVSCVTSLLRNLEMLDGAVSSPVDAYDEYRIRASVLFPDISYDFSKQFESYEPIRRGDVLARNPDGEEIVAPFDGHLIMPSSRRGLAKDISEEMAFISEPVITRELTHSFQ